MKLLVVWHNLKKDSYYWKIVSGNYVEYRVGFKNQYGHEIVLIIDDIFYRESTKKSIKERVLRKFISFLQNKLN